MPLFFLISGFTLKNKPEIPLWKIILIDAKKILLPYLIFCTASYVYAVILRDYFYNGENNIDFITRIFDMEKYNVALWFLPSLFISKVLLTIIIRIINRKFIKILLLFSLPIFITFYSRFINLPNYFPNIIASLWGCFFGLLMNLINFNKIVAIWNNFSNKKKIFIFLLLNVIAGIAFKISPGIDMRANTYNNPIIFIINALLISFIFFTISLKFQKNLILNTLGRNSLMILGTHIIILGLFIKLFENLPYSFDIYTVSFLSITCTLTTLFAGIYIWEKRAFNLVYKKLFN